MWKPFCVSLIVLFSIIVKLSSSLAEPPLCLTGDQLVYDVNANASVWLSAGDQHQSSVNMRGTVAVSHLTDHSELRVLDLTITGPSGETYENLLDLYKPIHFKHQESELLSVEFDKVDSHSSVSVKRALITSVLKGSAVLVSDGTTVSPQVQPMLNLLQDGDAKIILNDTLKDVILVLGNTGAGKSTFTQWIAGDSNQLEAKEVIEGYGEFIIKDKNNKISDSTLTSKTLYPDLIFDKDHNSAFYDFPGFSDTRNASSDVATSYFIKKTIDYVESVKIVFVINYPSVRKGVDRLDFMKLLKHATELINDIEKFQLSIAIVVTKVDYQYVIKNDLPVLVSDDQVIMGIVNVMQESKEDLEKRISGTLVPTEEFLFYVNAIKLIDIFTTKTGEYYNRIGIFRRPNEPGPLSNIHQIENEKRNIKIILHNTLYYTKKEIDDFDHTISEKSKYEIENLKHGVELKILRSICEVAEGVQDYYHDLIKRINLKINLNINTSTTQLTDVTILLNKLSVGSDIFEELPNKIRQMQHIENVTDIIYNEITGLNITVSNKSISDILTETMYLTFLQNIAEEDYYSKLVTTAWSTPFKAIQKDLAIAKEHFHKTIKHLNNQHQNEVIFKINNFGKSLKEYLSTTEEVCHDIYEIYKALNTNYNDWSDALDIAKSMTPSEYTNLIKNTANEINIHIANDSQLKLISDKYFHNLQDTLNSVVEYLHDSQLWYKFLIDLYNQLSVYEINVNNNYNYIFKQLTVLDVNKIVADTNMEQILKVFWRDDYPQYYNIIKHITLDKFKLQHLKAVVRVSLQKSETICHKDRLVVKGNHVKLSDVLYVTCPEKIKYLEIFALHKVFMDTIFNKTGEELNVAIIAPTWEIISEAAIILDGSPGPAHIEPKGFNGRQLCLDGENGKPGFPGVSGGTFFGVGNTFINSKMLVVSSNGGNGGPGQNGGDGARGVDGTVPIFNNPQEYLKNIGWYYDEDKYIGQIAYAEYKPIYGESCSNGGNGGQAGHGGYGGYSGNISIISISNDPILFGISNQTGNIGKFGSKGVPGFAGKSGKYVKMDWAPLRIGHVMSFKYFDLPQCANGKFVDDINEMDIKSPDQGVSLQKSLIINNYKSYLRECFSNSVVESAMQNFYFHLEQDSSIQALYDMPGFLDDTYKLEDQINILNSDTAVLFYQSLLQRIDYYIENIQLSNSSLKDYNVLNYIRVTLLSKTYKINNDLDNYLVVDLRKYFDIVSRHIVQYKNTLKQIKIDTYKVNYQNAINGRIVNAKKLMNQTLNLQIDKLYQQIDSQIKLLIRDISNKRKQVERDSAYLMEKQEKLAILLPIKGLLNIIKDIVKFMDIFSVVGSIITDSLDLESDFVNDARQMLNTANNTINQITGYFDRERGCMTHNLKTSLDIKNDSNDSLQTLQQKIQPLLNLVSERFLNNSDYFDEKKRTKLKLESYREELLAQKKLLNRSESDYIEEERKKLQSNIDGVTRVQNAISVAELGCDDVQSNQDLISAVGGEIERVKYQIEILNKYEQLIYQDLLPMRAKFQNVLYNFGLSFSKKSQIDIDVSKLKIQYIFQDFKTRIHFLIQPADPIIKSNIMSSIDKLQNIMLIVSQIYNHIHDYQDKINLAHYIANINSVSLTSDYNETNIEIRKLQLTTQSNLILQEYEKASASFKQYIFPFANLYLDHLGLLTNHNLNNISDLVHSATTGIEFLKHELTIDASVIKKSPYRVFPNIRFDSTRFEQPPFYVWTHDMYKKQITNLLQGQKVTILADVKRGIKENAIKFKEIGIRFISTNKTLQDELDGIMAEFLVELTHLGDSHYRCDNTVYVINHIEINMKHSVRKEILGPHYYHLDHTSTHIKHNPPMCSPYATWKIQLKNKYDDNFDALARFTDEAIDLALEGCGQYAELWLEVCNNNLQKYYNMMKGSSET